jgi:hypothetical protein
MSGIEFTPVRVDFGNIVLNEREARTITVTNNYSGTVRFKVTTNAPRLTVSESTITLTANQSIVLTVHLCVKHQGEVDRANDDYVRFRSDFHDFQVKVGYSIAQPFRSSSPARGSSPMRGGMISGNIRPQSSFRGKRNEKEMVEELSAQVKNQSNRIVELEKILGNLQSKYPNFDAVLDSHKKIQEQDFEDKVNKVDYFLIVCFVQQLTTCFRYFQ